MTVFYYPFYMLDFGVLPHLSSILGHQVQQTYFAITGTDFKSKFLNRNILNEIIKTKDYKQVYQTESVFDWFLNHV